MMNNVVGNYKILEKIGEGGMGAVYKGIDLMLEREVAIKALRPELASQPQIVERFRAEAVTLARLNHPNIATLYSFLRQRDDYFMVMEFVRGETLDAALNRSGGMLVETAITLFCQALEGIDHAHRMGIVHRDIKPANMMLTASGSIKVMDFGIARVLGSARMTRQGNIVGTIEYMSPEQVRGLEGDARSDIYSLGILLYEMLTGRVPFASTSEFELMRQQIEAAPAPPRQLASHIPADIEDSIMKALAKDPNQRFQTAGSWRNFLSGGRSGAQQILEHEISPQPPARPSGLDAMPRAAGETRVADQGNIPGEDHGGPGIKETRLASNVSDPLYVPDGPPAAFKQQRLPLLARLNLRHYLAAGIVLVLLLSAAYLLTKPGSSPRRATGETNSAQPAKPVSAPEQTPASRTPVAAPPQQAPILGLDAQPGKSNLPSFESEEARRERVRKEAEAKERARRRAAAEKALDK